MQHASSTEGRTGARASAGLAAAALVVAGLTCATPAQAADADYPATLDFSPSLVTADGGEVFAAGSDYSESDQGDWLPGSGYVSRVGGSGTVDLGDGTQVSSVTNQGDQVAALGTVSSGEDRAALWDLDFGAADPPTDAPRLFGPDEYPTALAQGADRLYAVGTTAEGHGQVWVDRERIPHGTFDANVTITAAATAVVDGAEVLLIAGTTTDENYAQHPALWTFTGEAPVTRLDLRPGTESYPTDLAVDPVTGTTYVATTGNGADDAIVVVEGGAVTDVAPQRDYIASLDVSEDGEDLYVASFSGVTVLDADPVTTSDQDNQLSYAWLGDGLSPAALVSGGPDRFYVAASNDDETGAVLSVGAPSSPTDLRATPGDYEGAPATISWTPSTPAGGFAEESLDYVVTVTDRAGGEPVVGTTFLTEYDVWEGLLPGHTYDVTVASTNYAFTSESAATVLTVPDGPVAHPSSIQIAGKPVVGAKLSVRTTGTWASGATVTTTWHADMAQIATGPSVTLTKAHLGKQIWASVTGRQAGRTTHTMYTAPSAKVATAPRLAAGKVQVTGVVKVGKTLTAKATGWPSGTRLTYRWAANTKALKGATKRTLKLARAHQGKRITVTVTGSKAGFPKVSRTSKATAKVTAVKKRRR